MSQKRGVPRMGAGAPTPWLGVIERVMIYGYLRWMATLAGALTWGNRDRPASARIE